MYECRTQQTTAVFNIPISWASTPKPPWVWSYLATGWICLWELISSLTEREEEHPRLRPMAAHKTRIPKQIVLEKEGLKAGVSYIWYTPDVRAPTTNILLYPKTARGTRGHQTNQQQSKWWSVDLYTMYVYNHVVKVYMCFVRSTSYQNIMMNDAMYRRTTSYVYFVRYLV